MPKSFDNFFWHDGNLTDVSFCVDSKGESTVQLQALFFKDEQAPHRDKYLIKCEAVTRFYCTLDGEELKSNMFAGNISNGYLKGNTLWVYFTDGLLEVRAQRFRLVKC